MNAKLLAIAIAMVACISIIYIPASDASSDVPEIYVTDGTQKISGLIYSPEYLPLNSKATSEGVQYSIEVGAELAVDRYLYIDYTGDTQFTIQVSFTGDIPQALQDAGYKMTLFDGDTEVASAVIGTDLTYFTSNDQNVEFDIGKNYRISLMTTEDSYTDLDTVKSTVWFTFVLAGDISEYTLTFQSSQPSYGIVSRASLVVPEGVIITIDGNTLTVAGTEVTATPNPPTQQWTYSFDGWSVQSGSTVTQDMAITANFSRSGPGPDPPTPPEPTPEHKETKEYDPSTGYETDTITDTTTKKDARTGQTTVEVTGTETIKNPAGDTVKETEFYTLKVTDRNGNVLSEKGTSKTTETDLITNQQTLTEETTESSTNQRTGITTTEVTGRVTVKNSERVVVKESEYSTTTSTDRSGAVITESKEISSTAKDPVTGQQTRSENGSVRTVDEETGETTLVTAASETLISAEGAVVRQSESSGSKVTDADGETVSESISTKETDLSGPVEKITVTESRMTKDYDVSLTAVEQGRECDVKVRGNAEGVTVGSEFKKDGECVIEVTAGDLSKYIEAVGMIDEAETLASDYTDKLGGNVTVHSAAGPLNVSEEVLEDMSGRGFSLTVQGTEATLTLDGDAIETAYSKQGEAVINIEKGDSDNLTPAQIETAGDNKVVVVTMTSGGEQVSELGGTATVSIPVSKDKESVDVEYVKDDGTTERMESEYDSQNGIVVFDTPHFSAYMVVEHDAPGPGPVPEDDDRTMIIGACVAGAIVAVILALLIVRWRSRS